jgi:ribonuclease P protein component
MKIRPNALQVSRFGFAVGGRLGKAVVRNKIKRRLREIVRLLGVQPGLDVLLIARTGALDADYESLKRSVASLMASADVQTTAVDAPTRSK